jgi:LysR family transcriptional regulator, low CO2-responsive transcriptional regulator
MASFADSVTLRQLRTLAAVETMKSVTGAARQLGLTQPAITLQIRTLQDLVGLPLLRRTNEGTMLTEVGANLAALHHRINAALSDSAAAISAIKGLSAGVVAVGAVSTAKYFMPFAIAGFSHLYPKIQIKLSIGNRREILDALRNYALDVAVTGRPPEDMDLDRRLIGPHPHMIIASPSHRLARLRETPLKELSDDTFIVREPGSGTRLLMERTFANQRFEPKVGMEIDSNETIKQAVMAGLGVAFISGHTVATELADLRLVALDIVGTPIVRNWYVVNRRDRELLPPALALTKFLSSESGRFLPDLPALKGRSGTAGDDARSRAGGARQSQIKRPRF